MRELTLSKGYVALVDDEDYERLNQFKWTAMECHRKDGTLRTVYAHRRERQPDGSRPIVWLHRLILNAPAGSHVDHIDCNGLNNIQSNLRLASQKDNAGNQRLRCDNSSGWKGVCWDADASKWAAQINCNGRITRVGRYNTAEEAAVAYDRAAITHFGQFALTNAQLKAAT